jgi:hypothetical protein
MMTRAVEAQKNKLILALAIRRPRHVARIFMNRSILALRRSRLAVIGLVAFCVWPAAPSAQAQSQIVINDPPFYGPYNAVFLSDGEGLKKSLAEPPAGHTGGLGGHDTRAETPPACPQSTLASAGWRLP